MKDNPKIVRPVGGENSALRELLNKTVPPKARAANSEEMGKLKDLISTKTHTPTQPIAPAPAPTPTPTPTSTAKTSVKEVPEDVLKKILE